MKLKKSWFVIVLICAAVCTALAIQESEPYKILFEKARFTMETKGDLKGAVELFDEIIKKHPNVRDYAAKSLYLMGTCYEKLGEQQSQQARAAYQKIIETYPKQTASVTLARERLALLSKGSTAQDNDLKIRKVLEGEGIGMDFYGSVSPNGRYISGPDREKRWNLAIRDLITGESRCLTEHRGGYNNQSLWSPNGKSLVYDWWFYSDPESSELRIIGEDGSGEKAIWAGKGTYIHTYAWSPDGTKILTQITQPEKMDLCLISIKDGSIRVLSRYPGSRQAIPIWLGCAFSPDGKNIACAREPVPEQSKQRDIYLLSLDNKEETPLVTHPANEYLLGWSKDGKHVLFASDRTGSIGVWSVQVEDGASRGILRLIKDNIGPIIPLGMTRDNALYYGHSPGGKDIYLAEMNPLSGRVISNPTKVDLPFEGHNGDPSYSPDGNRLAYVSNRGVSGLLRNNVLGIHDLLSGEDQEFDPNLTTLNHPRWSPDGRAIYTMGCVKPWEWALYRMEAETGRRSTVIAPEKKTDVFAYGWSPAGKPIYYVECSAGLNRDGMQDCRIIELNPETGGKKDIHEFNNSNSTAGLFAVSPNGVRLAFVQRDETQDIIYSMPTKGGSPKAVATNQKRITDLAWSPESGFVVFCAWDHADKKWELMRVPAEGGELQKLGLDSQANNAITAFSIRPDGRQIAFASGGENECLPEIWVMENLFPSDE